MSAGALGSAPCGPEDEAFLFELFRQVRGGLFAALGLPEAQLQGLLRMQYEAQQGHYRAAYPQLERRKLTLDGRPVGRLDLDRQPGLLRIVDIALLSAFQGQGLGGRVLAELLGEADAAGLAAELHVEQQNPAQRLYGRLGFEVRGGDGVYLAMLRPARASAAEGN